MDATDMDGIGQIETMVEEAIAALIHLDAERLEAIERQLSRMTSSSPSVSRLELRPGSHTVESRLESLRLSLAMTESNLAVLERIAASRRAGVA